SMKAYSLPPRRTLPPTSTPGSVANSASRPSGGQYRRWASVKRTRHGVGRPVAASLTRTWTVGMAHPLPVGGPGPVEDRRERGDRLGEQLGTGDAAGRPAAEQVRLQRGEAVVGLRHLADHLGDAPLPFPGEAAVLL